MTVWFTSDWHLGHQNILHLGVGRPFSTIEQHNNALIDNWNDLVDSEDIGWFLGDMCMGSMNESLPLIQRLKGKKKFLVPGNHDRCAEFFKRQTQDKLVHWRAAYRDAGFELLEPVGHFYHFRQRFDYCHFPYRQAPKEVKERYVEQHPPNYGHPLLHGHVHTQWRRKDNQLNVGVDVNDFCPVSMNTILKEFNIEH